MLLKAFVYFPLIWLFGLIVVKKFTFRNRRTKTQEKYFSCCKFAVLSFISLYLHNFYLENSETIHSVILSIPWNFFFVISFHLEITNPCLDYQINSFLLIINFLMGEWNSRNIPSTDLLVNDHKLFDAACTLCNKSVHWWTENIWYGR